MSSFRRFVVAACLLVSAPALRAQQLPTPDQARRLLETRPDLAGQIRREIAGSGLTPDQIRARLRASGYPEDLLDTYLRGRSGRDSLATGLPSDDVLDAVAALGLSDTTDARAQRDSLRGLLRARRPRDTTRLGRDEREAREVTLDSLADARGDSLTDADSLVVDSLDRLTPRRRAGRRVRAEAVDTGMTIFGLNVFAGATTQFDPNLAGPVDASYRLGPGDRLVLLITGDAERAFTLDVTREGFVVIPGVGELPVASLTLGQLEDVLYQRLGRVYSGLRRGPGATTRFSLNVARLHTNQIYVLGDVDQPGSYRVSSAGTALTALYAAGGPTPNGSLRRVEVRRAGRAVDTLDLYDYFLRADGSHDPRLQSGDVVFVPVHGPRVRVYGEVVRPSTYELRDRETLADVLRAAGGFTAAAVRRRVQVSRILPPNERDADRGRVVVDVQSGLGARDSGLGNDDRVPRPEFRVPAFKMEDGDVIRVFPVNERVARRVTVKGDVWSPGVVGFSAGMKLSEAIRMAGGLKPDAYLGQVLVSRLRPADSARVQLRSAFRDAGAPTDDLVLQDDDEIRVFSVGEMKPATYVAITGAVRRPGRYAYREGMTLRDLVLVAGGLDRRAYLGEAEIATPPADGAEAPNGKLAVARRVPLDSTYLLVADRGDRGDRNDGQAGPRAVPEVALEPFANVLVFAQPDGGAERARRVTLTGEVRLPGTYTLLSKDERLSDLLARAGGPTKAAYVDGVAFYRGRGVGRVGVDLPHVLRDPHFRDNLLLQDGDSVHLPPYSGVVEVQGAVNAPHAVAWVPGQGLDYYVRAAGGATRLGDARRAYVTQPDGAVESVVARRMMPDVVPTPKPGSVVYVTQRDAADHGAESMQKLAVMAQILGALTTLAVVLRR